MDSSFAVSAGEALVASIGEMTQSSTNKLIDISRKVTLARLLDDTTSNTNTNANANNENTDGKENGTLTINAAGQNAVLSERSNNTSSSSGGSNIGRTTARTNHGAVEALRDLRDLSTIVSEIERRAATLRDAIDTHRRDNEARREMSETTRQQTAQLAATLLALPEHLPHAAPQPASSAATATSSADRTAPSAESGPVARSRGNPAAAGAEAGRVATSDLPEVPVLELVTVGELEGVPRSTRARLTIEQVNAAVAEIQKAVERRCVSHFSICGDGFTRVGMRRWRAFFQHLCCVRAIGSRASAWSRHI